MPMDEENVAVQIAGGFALKGMYVGAFLDRGFGYGVHDLERIETNTGLLSATPGREDWVKCLTSYETTLLWHEIGQDSLSLKTKRM